MQVAAPGEFQPRPQTETKLLHVLLGILLARFKGLGVFSPGPLQFGSFAYQFLPHIRWVAHHCVKVGKLYRTLLPRAPGGAFLRRPGDRAECLLLVRDLEKVPATDKRVIRFVSDVPGRQVERGQVSREEGNVASEYLAQQDLVGFLSILMAPPAARLLREPRFAVVCPNKEATRTARGIEHNIAGTTDTEGVDDVYDVFAREELSELLSFLRGDQTLKDASDDIVGNVAEVVIPQMFKNPFPSLAGLR